MYTAHHSRACTFEIVCSHATPAPSSTGAGDRRPVEAPAAGPAECRVRQVASTHPMTAFGQRLVR
jgi:hypothetical protein